MKGYIIFGLFALGISAGARAQEAQCRMDGNPGCPTGRSCIRGWMGTAPTNIDPGTCMTPAEADAEYKRREDHIRNGGSPPPAAKGIDVGTKKTAKKAQVCRLVPKQAPIMTPLISPKTLDAFKKALEATQTRKPASGTNQATETISLMPNSIVSPFRFCHQDPDQQTAKPGICACENDYNAIQKRGCIDIKYDPNAADGEKCAMTINENCAY